MCLIVCIIIPWAQDYHPTRSSHSFELASLILRIIPEDMTSHGYIGKVIMEGNISDQAINWIDVIDT